MKTKFLSFILLISMSFGAYAQLDRSKMPKPGPAPKIQLGVPDEFELSNGLKVLIVENHKLPRVSFNLSIDNPPKVEGDKAGVSDILSAMLGNGTANISKDDFNEEIDFLGARMNFGSNGGFASGLSKYSDRILELMADATMNSLLTEDEFKKQIDLLKEGLKTQEKDVAAISARVAKALAYGTNHPYGEFTTQETLDNITLDNVRAFYQGNFNPQNAYLAIVGDVDPVKIKMQIEKYFGSWQKGIDVTYNVPSASPNAQYNQINFVDVPNAVQSNISLTNTANLQMKDKDYHSVLIANKILGGGFGSYLNMNLREKHGYTYGARSAINTDKYTVSRFRAGATVRNMVTDSAIVQTIKEINRIKTEDVSTKDLVNAKAKYMGDFVLALERPSTIAQYALNVKINDLPSDFYTTYLEKINAVSKDDVKRVSNTYFKPENARFVVIGKGSDVIENLEKTGIPIKYYDKFAGATEKPNYDIELPAGVDANTILKKYISAIGGKEKVNAISSVVLKYETTAMGATIVQEERRTDDKYAQITSMNGNPMMSVVAKDSEMYMKQGANKMPMPQAMLDDLKPAIGVFPELAYIRSNKAKLTGKENINGKDAYKIEIPGESMSFTMYYDIETGLKVKEISTIKMQGQTQKQESEFSDYQEIEGIKFPQAKTGSLGPQTATFKLIEATINKLTDADFED